jgi:hypothetical protein
MDVEIHRHTLSVAASLLLLVGSQVQAGTITCNDQVGALKAMLADHLDKSIREQINEAARLCREGRDAEARNLMTQARAAVAAEGPGAATSGPSPHK